MLFSHLRTYEGFPLLAALCPISSARFLKIPLIIWLQSSARFNFLLTPQHAPLLYVSRVPSVSSELACEADLAVAALPSVDYRFSCLQGLVPIKPPS